MKTYNQYVEELNTVYEEAYSDDGICPYYSQCSANGERPKIQCDFATRVGINYGQKDMPKVVCLGQESIHEHREHQNPASTLNEAHNDHYRKTLYTLALALMGEQPISYAQKDLRKYEDLLTCYCLTNYYKCVFTNDEKKRHGLNHSKAMTENCYKILLRELEILEPDLLIVQGKFTTVNFWNSLDAIYSKGKRVYGNKTELTDTVSLYKYEKQGKDLFVLYGYHPSAIHQWENTRDGFVTAINTFRELWLRNRMQSCDEIE